MLIFIIFSSSIRAFCDDGETTIAVIPATKERSSKKYVIYNSGTGTYVTKEELEEEAANKALIESQEAESSGGEGVATYSSNEDGGTMEAGLAVYEAPQVTGISSEGSWEWVYDSDAGAFRYVGTDNEKYAAGGWVYITSGDSTITSTGNWYYFDEDGLLVTGWIKNGDDWYYTSELEESSGRMVTGFYSDESDGYTYYFDPLTGVMLTGWQKINKFWYYFTDYGDISGDSWTYSEEAGKWVYASTGSHPLGSMYRNEGTPDGWMIDHTGRAVE